ncbi:MAG: endonuclease/exonuclease/phosphatase family protein [Acidimicrobiales bacterium]
MYSRYPLRRSRHVGAALRAARRTGSCRRPWWAGGALCAAPHQGVAERSEAAISVGSQHDIAMAVRDAIDAEQSPVIVAGDLNLVDRQETFRDFADGLRDAMRAGAWAGPTSAKEGFVWRALLARIDHVLVTPSLCAASPERFELPTSDHHGLAVTVGPCATD